MATARPAGCRGRDTPPHAAFADLVFDAIRTQGVTRSQRLRWNPLRQRQSFARRGLIEKARLR